MIAKRMVATLLTTGMLLSGTPALWAQSPPPPPPAPGASEPQQGYQRRATGATPARISYINGDVSFWRPGAAEWTPARVNTPLAPGDALYTGPTGNVEVQIGARAFVRAPEGTQLGLDNQEPDFVQFRVTVGHAALDLRELAPGQTIELDTPNAAFTIERTGYYHVDVTQDSTSFRIRRGGRATMTPVGGSATPVASDRQVVVTGTDNPRVDTGRAPEFTEWERWNYQRTDLLITSPSAQYVPRDVYGTQELDRHGSWRVVESYGSVWVPTRVASGWSPYSTGRWIWDPRYGWTWLDDEPWGWAPYHYGRWVHTSGFWGWAPGPIVVRPVYAPALVVFLGGGVRLSLGLPLAWAPLGWGEPVIPWWGRRGYISRPTWDGWGGPRVVNNTVINNTTVVNVQNITVYRNVAGPSSAVVALPADRFGRADLRPSRLSHADVQQLTPVRGALAVKPVAASLAPSSGTAIKPPETIIGRSVVATRPPRDFTRALKAEGLATTTPATEPGAAPRLVRAPKKESPAARAAGAAGATPAIGIPTPAQPDGKSDKAAGRPPPPAPASVATPPQKPEPPRAVAPAQPDAKRDKAAGRPQPPAPPTVATPPQKPEPPRAVAPAQPDPKRDKAAGRPQPPAPPTVATPPQKPEPPRAVAPAQPDAKPEKKAGEPVAAAPDPEPGRPRPARP